MDINLNSIKKNFSADNIFIQVFLYFSASLLVSMILCYIVFSIKISSQKSNLNELDIQIQEIGTKAQKDKEDQVFSIQKKVQDYSKLINEHRLTSNAFGFIEKETLPKVWFSRISLSDSDGAILLFGETENLEALSRQISHFESNEYVKSVDVLSSSVGSAGRVNFNLNMKLESLLFEF